MSTAEVMMDVSVEFIMDDQQQQLTDDFNLGLSTQHISNNPYFT